MDARFFRWQYGSASEIFGLLTDRFSLRPSRSLSIKVDLRQARGIFKRPGLLFLHSIEIPEAERSSSRWSRRPKSVLINQSPAWASSPAFPQLLAKQMDSACLMSLGEVVVTRTFNDLSRPKNSGTCQEPPSKPGKRFGQCHTTLSHGRR